MAGFDAKECNRRNQIPTPTEGDCISRKWLKEAIDKDAEDICGIEDVIDYIDNAPTVPLPNEQIAWEQGYEAGLARPKGEWIDYSETDGYVECPFCGSCTTCEGNKDELHFCFNCGADMKGGAENA